MRSLKGTFSEFLKAKGLRHTSQRDVILDTFLGTEKHLSADKIYGLVKKKDPKIGYATVYRTIKLLCEVGIAREINFGDGRMRYEHKYRHKHHDHLMCIKCGKSIEVFDKELERIQTKLAEESGFIAIDHQLNVFGICNKCKKRS